MNFKVCEKKIRKKLIKTFIRRSKNAVRVLWTFKFQLYDDLNNS